MRVSGITWRNRETDDAQRVTPKLTAGHSCYFIQVNTPRDQLQWARRWLSQTIGNRAFYHSRVNDRFYCLERWSLNRTAGVRVMLVKTRVPNCNCRSIWPAFPGAKPTLLIAQLEWPYLPPTTYKVVVTDKVRLRRILLPKGQSFHITSMVPSLCGSRYPGPEKYWLGGWRVVQKRLIHFFFLATSAGRVIAKG